MSTGPQVTIAEAKRLCYDLRKIGVVVIAFNADGSFEGASYGMRRETCDRLRGFLDEVCDGIRDGTFKAFAD